MISDCIFIFEKRNVIFMIFNSTKREYIMYFDIIQ